MALLSQASQAITRAVSSDDDKSDDNVRHKSCKAMHIALYIHKMVFINVHSNVGVKFLEKKKPTKKKKKKTLSHEDSGSSLSGQSDISVPLQDSGPWSTNTKRRWVPSWAVRFDCKPCLVRARPGLFLEPKSKLRLGAGSTQPAHRCVTSGDPAETTAMMFGHVPTRVNQQMMAGKPAKGYRDMKYKFWNDRMKKCCKRTTTTTTKKNPTKNPNIIKTWETWMTLEPIRMILDSTDTDTGAVWMSEMNRHTLALPRKQI